MSTKQQLLTLAGIICLTICLPARCFGSAAGPRVLPNIGPVTGPKLLNLARKAMRDYLVERIDARQAAIPADLRCLRLRVDGKDVSPTDVEYPVCVTLRNKGKIVGRSLKAGNGLVRNVIAAALEAMRSPGLPDRVTAKLLDSMTIELEILGKEKIIPHNHVHKWITPGREGLKLTSGVLDKKLTGPYLSRAYQESIVLPSMAYAMNWNARQMRKQCLLDLAITPEGRDLKRRWKIFATLHYVGYPAKGGTWLLYRGKLLLDDKQRSSSSNSNNTLSDAMRTGDFLIRRQRKSGRYSLPGGSTEIAEHLYAAYAMAKLGRRVGKTNADLANRYAASANAALGYVAQNFAKRDKDKKTTHVVTVDPKAGISATAMFVLTAAALPADSKGGDIQQAMVRYLRGRIDKTGAVIDEAGEPADSLSAATALLALYKSGIPADDSACGKALEALLRLSGRMGQLPANGKKLTALETAWLGRAILAGAGGPKQRLAYFVPQLSRQLLDRQAMRGGSPDEIGTIRIADGTASTRATGAAMVFLRQAKGGVELKSKSGSESLKRLGRSLAAGRAFCLQMTYQPVEAYFAARPIEWTGAVRAWPGGKRVSLAACAAAIEAMLSE